MSNFVDYSGQKFGRLTVLSRAENKNGRTMFNCVCECGNKKAIWIESLKNGSTKSCGCLSREIVTARNYRHGQRHTRLYRIWLTMKSRCYLPSQVGYKYYGGQGVTVCDEWKNDFMSFHDWAMNNGYEETLTIDRIDPYGNYEPSSSRWSTYYMQEHNKRNREEAFRKGAEKRKKKVICLDTQVVYPSIKEASQETGVTAGQIVEVCKGRIKTAHGMKFSYYNGDQ